MHDEAKQMFDSGMSLTDIAARLNIPAGTVRGWKSKERWNAGTPKRSKSDKAVESVMNNPALTDKQRMFCLHYSRSFNATKSYQKAYECSYESALRSGPELLGNIGVRDEINRLKEQRYAQALLKPEDIFQKYMDIAFADISDFLSWGQEEVPVEVQEDYETGEKKLITRLMNVVNFRESANVDGSILSEVKQGKDGASIKLSDRMKALDWLTEHMNMATEEQTAKIDQIKATTKKLQDQPESTSSKVVIQYDI